VRPAKQCDRCNVALQFFAETVRQPRETPSTNERTCFTCHQPATGWTVSAASVQARFLLSGGNDPIFRLVDGATCPTDDVSTPLAKLRSYKLLLKKGLIRIGLPLPAGSQFTVTKVTDPYGCTTNPATGLTSPTSGIMSMCRRPLPATNLGFLSTIMWDGREPTQARQPMPLSGMHKPIRRQPPRRSRRSSLSRAAYSPHRNSTTPPSFCMTTARPADLSRCDSNFRTSLSVSTTRWAKIRMAPLSTPRSSTCISRGWGSLAEVR
jgi:hypothetical protein